MSIRELVPGERTDTHSGTSSYAGYGIHAVRGSGNTATITAFGRSNADDRDEIAAKMATLTESWTIETIETRRQWRVTYRTTHRILPIEGASK